MKTLIEHYQDRVEFHKESMNVANDKGDFDGFRYHFHMLVKATGSLNTQKRKLNQVVIKVGA